MNSKLTELGFKVADIENMSEDAGQIIIVKYNKIGYFGEADQKIVQRIFSIISAQLSKDLKITFINRYAQSKNIEI